MQNPTPLSSPAASAPSRGRRLLRFLLQTKSGRVSGVVLCILAIGGLVWLDQNRTFRWSQAINPAYWISRWRGEDLFLPQEGVLLRGSYDLPEVALTFDDGPHRNSRLQMLATLQKYHIHATFFEVGLRMAQSPELERRTLAEGHEIGNHTYHHDPPLDKLSARSRHRELNDVDILYYSITGQHLHLMRPPHMRYNADVLTTTYDLGYMVVGYTAACNDFDFRHETPATITARILRRAHNGGILLLHDYPLTAAALPGIIEGLQARGYRFVTISEMVRHLPERPRLAAERFQRDHADEAGPAGLTLVPAAVQSPR